jgi:hypothetical protein
MLSTGLHLTSESTLPALAEVFNILPQFSRDCVKKSTGSTQRSCYGPNSCFSLGRRG